MMKTFLKLMSEFKSKVQKAHRKPSRANAKQAKQNKTTTFKSYHFQTTEN